MGAKECTHGRYYFEFYCYYNIPPVRVFHSEQFSQGEVPCYDEHTSETNLSLDGSPGIN